MLETYSLKTCSLETYSLKTCTLKTMHARDDLLNSVYLVINRMKFPFVRFPSSLVCTRNKLFLFIYIILFPLQILHFNFLEKTYRFESKKKSDRHLDIDLITFTQQIHLINQLINQLINSNSYPPSIDCFCLKMGDS